MDSSITTGTPAQTVTITINLPELTHNGQRVITLANMDAVHERPEGTARRNFNANKDKLVDGEDYFVIGADEFRTHLDPSLSKFAGREITLLTESGYLLLVKSFTDDLAWKVQRQLVKGYFRAKQEAQTPMPDAAAVEYLTPNDAANVRNVIHWIAKPFQYERSVSNAIWFGLRQVLNWPSPQPFTVEQLPRIAQELGRINNIAYQVQEIIRDMEVQAIRRILRKGEDAEMVLIHLRKQVEKDMAEVTEFYSKLPTYITNDLNAITMRKPHHGYLKANTQEQPDFFKA